MNFKNVIMLSLGMTLLFMVTSLVKRKLTEKPTHDVAQIEDEDERPMFKNKKNKSSNRTPSAYTVDSRQADQSTKFSARTVEGGANNSYENDKDSNPEDSANGFAGEETNEPTRPEKNRQNKKITASSDLENELKENNTDLNNSLPDYTGSITISGAGLPRPSNTPTDDEPNTPPQDVNETSLTCSTDVGSGSYSNPVSVSVTCSTSSEITYCVGPGGVCCDPSSGSVYSGPIPIGATNGNYCLKFSATAVNGKTASGQKDYVITVSLPELTVTTEKIQYQTTELPGLMSISSNNFGYASHSMGVINLKGHDPGASGLNMSCEDIVVNHGTLSSPTPSVPMAEASITGIPANTQIDAMIGIDDLVYGTNYITNYVVSYQEAVPLYACSTVEKKIWDFTYFDHMPSHGDPGSNTVREFAGSFTHLGFFEPAATVYRGPAGETTSTDASDELQVGLFGVVY